VTIRLYLDDDASAKSLVKALRERSVDVITALEIGMGGRDDEVHLEYAAAQGRVLYSFNRGDFCRLHSEWLASGKSHTGIILSFQKYDVGEQMRRLLKLIALKTAEEMRNQVEFLSNWG
jgi:hypothetical protein